MSTNDYISDVTANLTEWGITYRETTEGVSVGDIHLEVAEEGYRPIATILNGTELVGMTSDADKAAALLALPLARKAWAIGYAGDFEIDVQDDMLDMRLYYGSESVAIYAATDSDLEFTVAEHPLFSGHVAMTDMSAALESTEIAYQDQAEAWQVLCGATDFEDDDWTSIVSLFQWNVSFDQGDRFMKVSTGESDNVVLVEDCDEESPIRVIDVDANTDVACWTPGDAAAAVLYAIS